MPLLEGFPVKFNPRRVVQNLRLEKKDQASVIARELIDQASRLVRPKALFKVSYIKDKEKDAVRINSTPFFSRVLRKNLDKVERVFPYLITIGKALEDKASSQGDLLQQYYLESLGDMALSLSEKHLEGHLKRHYGLEKLSSMSPGSLKDWPIEEQKPLFSLLGDVEKLVGVRLTEKMLMIPRKSISGIFFPKEVTFLSCQLCPRERCPARIAPYDDDLRKTYGLDEE
jgi:hypothetical protein